MEDSDILTLGWGCEAPPTSGLWSHTHGGGGGGGPEEFVTLEESQTYARRQPHSVLYMMYCIYLFKGSISQISDGNIIQQKGWISLRITCDNILFL